MGSLMPDQQQAQVPVAVEGAFEPHEELANSTSGAAYERETSGDGEARQMAASHDDTAELFGEYYSTYDIITDIIELISSWVRPESTLLPGLQVPVYVLDMYYEV